MGASDSLTPIPKFTRSSEPIHSGPNYLRALDLSKLNYYQQQSLRHIQERVGWAGHLIDQGKDGVWLGPREVTVPEGRVLWTQVPPGQSLQVFRRKSKKPHTEVPNF